MDGEDLATQGTEASMAMYYQTIDALEQKKFCSSTDTLICLC